MLADTNLSAGRLRVSGRQGRGRHAALLSAALHLALAGAGLGIWETRASAPAAPLMVVELVAPDMPAPVAPPAPAPVLPETRPEVPQATTPVVPAKAPKPPARPRPTPTPVVAPAQAVAHVAALAEAAPPPPPAAVAEDTPAPVLTASPAAAAVDEEMAHYALAVRLALGRAARNHAGPKGRVEIAFGLDGQGGVRTGSIARSSGKPELDASALALVRATAFPLPPANSTDAQRSYVIPIEVR